MPKKAIPPLTKDAIFKAPRIQRTEASMTIPFNGEEVSVTIDTSARQDAALMMELLALVQQAAVDCGRVSLVPLADGQTVGLRCVAPDGEIIHIKEPAYLGQLYVLARVATSPQMAVTEWAIALQRLGDSEVAWELLDWALVENGVGAALNKKLAQAVAGDLGKSLSMPGSEGSSSGSV